MKSTRAILVFHQAPSEEARRKRLLHGASWDAARRLLEANLRHTLNAARQAGSADVILCYDNARPRDGRGVDLYLAQTGHRLGDRMRNAAAAARALGYRDLLIVGTDSPGVNAGVFRGAFDALRRSDYVVGPSADGGFFLIGFGAARVDELPVLLASLPWFTRHVRTQLLRRVAALGASHVMLDELRDVDGWSDARLLGEPAWSTLADLSLFLDAARSWARAAGAALRLRLLRLSHTAVPAPPAFSL